MDARVHQLQGKAEFVTSPESPASSATLPLLLEFYTDKLGALLRHQANARLVGQYDANNT